MQVLRGTPNQTKFTDQWLGMSHFLFHYALDQTFK
jgi:hypothetical protein